MLILFLLSLSVYRVQICPIYVHVIRKNFQRELFHIFYFMKHSTTPILLTFHYLASYLTAEIGLIQRKWTPCLKQANKQTQINYNYLPFYGCSASVPSEGYVFHMGSLSHPVPSTRRLLPL